MADGPVTVCNCSCPPGTSYCQPSRGYGTTNPPTFYQTYPWQVAYWSSPPEPLTLEAIREIIREEIAAAKQDPAAGKPWGPQKP